MLLALGLALALPPNFVYIMADDLGYGDLGCYGQKKIPTPNIDRLAAEGIRFTRFYSASTVCAPTRCSLLTGKHQGHAYVRGNKEVGDFSLNGKEGQFALSTGTTTIAEVLRDAKYRTALIGKWGLGGPLPGATPLDHGFDEFFGYLCQRRAHNYYPVYLWRNRQPYILRSNRAFEAHQKLTEPLTSEAEYQNRYTGGDYAPEAMLNECVRFIRENKGKPFFLYHAPTLPHVALQAPPEWVAKFPREWDTTPYLGQNGYLPNPRPRATYAAMVAYLDYSVGEIRRAIDEAGLGTNTLIIVTSDNGAVARVGGADLDFFDSNGGLRGSKMSLYEGGIRVPCVAWWPGVVPRNSTCADITTAYDSFATIAELAGVRGPKSDGRSYARSLRGQPTSPREFAYFEYPESTVMQAAVFGQYKAIKPNLSKDPTRLDIYDLDADPRESRDISKTRPDLVRKAQTIFAREHGKSADFPLKGID